MNIYIQGVHLTVSPFHCVFSLTDHPALQSILPLTQHGKSHPKNARLLRSVRILA